jgi:hypothetical protein
MLHSVPALVDELEARLISGQDPLPLLASVNWGQLVGWPVDLEQAVGLKQRVSAVMYLLSGLNAPVRATLMALNGSATYRPGSGKPNLALPERFHQEI